MKMPFLHGKEVGLVTQRLVRLSLAPKVPGSRQCAHKIFQKLCLITQQQNLYSSLISTGTWGGETCDEEEAGVSRKLLPLQVGSL